MEPQPSTSSAGASTAGACDGGPSSTDGVKEAVPSTSGSVAVPVQQQPELQLFVSGGASFKQCQQLFVATCHVKLKRCQRMTPNPAKSNESFVTTTTSSAEHRPADSVSKSSSKVVNESAATGSSFSSSSEEDDVKVFAPSTSSVPSSSKKRPVSTPTLSTKNNASVGPPSANPWVVGVNKVEDDSSSCSEDDEVKFLPPPPAAPPSKKKRPVTKKKRGKRVIQRKSPVPCPVCNKRISSKITLKIHMRKHTGEERYKCEKCERSFWNWSTFSDHKKVRDQRNGACPQERKKVVGWRPKGSWTCEICGKWMKCGSHYAPHMRSHPGSKPFKCEDCGKAFGRSKDFSVHRRIHSGVWQCTCVFCDRGFHQQSNMFRHLRIHTDERPFFCVVDECGESFRHSQSLKKHRRLIHLKKY